LDIRPDYTGQVYVMSEAEQLVGPEKQKAGLSYHARLHTRKMIG